MKRRDVNAIHIKTEKKEKTKNARSMEFFTMYPYQYEDYKWKVDCKVIVTSEKPLPTYLALQKLLYSFHELYQENVEMKEIYLFLILITGLRSKDYSPENGPYRYSMELHDRVHLRSNMIARASSTNHKVSLIYPYQLGDGNNLISISLNLYPTEVPCEALEDLYFKCVPRLGRFLPISVFIKDLPLEIRGSCPWTILPKTKTKDSTKNENY